MVIIMNQHVKVNYSALFSFRFYDMSLLCIVRSCPISNASLLCLF